jgi:FixJ family two-component response regulator
LERAGGDVEKIYLLTCIPVGIGVVMRLCKTCEHLKRPEIDRRLAAGEPSTRIAHDYGLSASSVHRHKTNCLKLLRTRSRKKLPREAPRWR